MPRFSPRGFAEELQDYVAGESGLGYAVGADLFLANELDLDGDAKLASMTMYEEGADLSPRERIPKQERTFRFAFRDSHEQGALNRAWDFVAWIGGLVAFATTTFSVKVLRIDKGPSAIEARRSGTFLADAVVTFLVMNRTD